METRKICLHSDTFNSIAAAFTTVVTSFVSEILLPPLSLLPFVHRNLDEKFAVLKKGPHYNGTYGHGYNTLEQATADGAVVMAYGSVYLLLSFDSFLIVFSSFAFEILARKIHLVYPWASVLIHRRNRGWD